MICHERTSSPHHGVAILVKISIIAKSVKSERPIWRDCVNFRRDWPLGQLGPPVILVRAASSRHAHQCSSAPGWARGRSRRGNASDYRGMAISPRVRGSASVTSAACACQCVVWSHSRRDAGRNWATGESGHLAAQAAKSKTCRRPATACRPEALRDGQPAPKPRRASRSGRPVGHREPYPGCADKPDPRECRAGGGRRR